MPTATASQLESLRADLLAHPLYAAVDSLPRLRQFMAAHVFAVWDFMALAKRLQRDLTCTTVPWVPPADARLARFINEVVVAEESDLGPEGTPMSHVELYVAGMEEVGADIAPFQEFLRRVRTGAAPDDALAQVGAPPHVREFVNATLTYAVAGSTAEVAAVFLYGREDIIPDMFRALLHQWERDPGAVPAFAYYLERHIHLDGDLHGPAAAAMLEALTRDDPQRCAAADHAAHAAIAARIALWDSVLLSLDAA